MASSINSRSPIYFHRRTQSSSYTQETCQTNPDETLDILPTRSRLQTQETSKSFVSFSPKPKAANQIPRPKSSMSSSKASRIVQTQEDSRLSVSASKNKSISQERDMNMRSFQVPSPANPTPISKATSMRCISARSSISKLQTEPSMNDQSKSPRLFSDYAVKRMESEKKAQRQGIRLGLEGLDTALHRKSLENQVKILENRLNKLKLEEVSMAKKIKETSDKTDKILWSKRRRQEDLQKKEMKNRKREEDLQRKRLEVMKDKQELKEGLRRSSMGNLKHKHETACSTKVANDQEKARKEEIQRKRDERNKEVIAKVNGGINSSMMMKNNKDMDKVNDANYKYKERIMKDKEAADHLAQKCKELENIEHQMLEKLSQTYNMHKAKIVELEKAFTIKVKAGEEFY